MNFRGSLYFNGHF